MKPAARGFTLIELLIALAIVGIITAVALPSYRDYVTRGRLTEGFTSLSSVQASLEQYWSNTRSYSGFTPLPTSPNFTYALTTATASAYTVTATGVGPVAGFVYTIDQSGTRVTTGVPAGWTTNATCWVDRKGGTCTQ